MVPAETVHAVKNVGGGDAAELATYVVEKGKPRFVHDELVRYGWEVLVADAQRVKGLAPLACKTDKVDARVLAELSFRDLVPAIWLPTPELRAERERSRWRLHLVKHRATLEKCFAVPRRARSPCR